VTGFFFASASHGRSRANPAGEDCHGVIGAADEAGQSIIHRPTNAGHLGAIAARFATGISASPRPFPALRREKRGKS